MGKQSGIRQDSETMLYTALTPTWNNIFQKRPCVKWCKTTQLEYENQLQAIFEGRSAIGVKAASYSTLQNNSTTSNQIFDPLLLATTEDTQEETGLTSRSYLDQIDDKFTDPLSEKESTPLAVSNDNVDSKPPQKKAKLSKDATIKKGLKTHLSADETPFSTTKTNKKKSAGLELAHQMQEWHHSQELAGLSPEV